MEDNLYLVKMRKCAVTMEDMTLQMMVNVETNWRSEPDKLPKSNRLQDPTRHHHQYSEIFICLAGEVWLNAPAGLLQLMAGDLAIVPCGVPHVHIPRLQEEDWCAFSFTGIRRQGGSHQPLYRLCEPFFNGEDILVLRGHPELCRMGLECIAEMRRGADYLPALRLAELLLRIRELQPDALPVVVPEHENELSRSSYLEYLVNNYFTQSVTAQQLADKMYISPRQLARIIKRQYGSTLHELMMSKRIATAEHLLLTTALTVDEVAHAVGFNSRTGFYREFLKRYGITPSQFRQEKLER